jgi:drug/metabolite transporter (DMT)-like permease
VALFVYIQPVIATAVAWFYRGEIITPRTIMSSALIFMGVILSLPRETKR